MHAPAVAFLITSAALTASALPQGGLSFSNFNLSLPSTGQIKAAEGWVDHIIDVAKGPSSAPSAPPTSSSTPAASTTVPSPVTPKVAALQDNAPPPGLAQNGAGAGAGAGDIQIVPLRGPAPLKRDVDTTTTDLVLDPNVAEDGLSTQELEDAAELFTSMLAAAQTMLPSSPTSYPAAASASSTATPMEQQRNSMSNSSASYKASPQPYSSPANTIWIQGADNEVVSGAAKVKRSKAMFKKTMCFIFFFACPDFKDNSLHKRQVSDSFEGATTILSSADKEGDLLERRSPRSGFCKVFPVLCNYVEGKGLHARDFAKV